MHRLYEWVGGLVFASLLFSLHCNVAGRWAILPFFPNPMQYLDVSGYSDLLEANGSDIETDENRLEPFPLVCSASSASSAARCMLGIVGFVTQKIESFVHF